MVDMSATPARPRLTPEQREARRKEAIARARRLERIHNIPTVDQSLRDAGFTGRYLQTLKAECETAAERIPRFRPTVGRQPQTLPR